MSNELVLTFNLHKITLSRKRRGKFVRSPVRLWPVYLLLLFLVTLTALAEDPKPTPSNTISVKLENEIKPQSFPRPIKFFIDKVIDRSSNPQPLLVLKERGGVFLDKQPTEIVEHALEETLEKSGLLTLDRASANYLLTVYLFHFGLAQGAGFEFYGKVELNVVVKDAASGKSQTIAALGTSIQGGAVRKKSIIKNVEANINDALEAALRNFLRGTKLRDAVAVPETKPNSARAPVSAPSLQEMKTGTDLELNIEPTVLSAWRR
jgi:hypothetical protein